MSSSTRKRKSDAKDTAIPGMAVVACFVGGIVSIFSGIVATAAFDPMGAAACYFVGTLAFTVILYISFGGNR